MRGWPNKGRIDHTPAPNVRWLSKDMSSAGADPTRWYPAGYYPRGDQEKAIRKETFLQEVVPLGVILGQVILYFT